MAAILFLAPQPFFQERGTPIAIDLALRALEEDGHQIDLVTYAEGKSLQYQRLRHFRVPRIPGVSSVPPGFSWKKLVCSFLMIFTALRLACSRHYDIVHAVEEACFIALLLRLVRRLPYVYDMDSSIAQQMVQKKPALRPLAGLMNRLEGLAIRYALAVIAVCPALVDLALKNGARQVLLLQDISLLDRCQPGDAITDLRREMVTDAPLLLYVGNLESYQGIDLLLDGFALAIEQGAKAALAVIGGQSHDIIRYQQRVQQLGIADRCCFFGPRPVNDIGAYLAQADILLSPRSTGNNTPMKIYTYLAAGKALLATRISSHTQALDDSIACLVEPTPKGMAHGITLLCGDGKLRHLLGEAGLRKAEEKHSWPAFRRILNEFYRTLMADRERFE